MGQLILCFLVEFSDPTDQDAALGFAMWFHGRKFLYTFPWVPNFDVGIGNYCMLLVWVEFPFCSIFLKC